MLIITRRLYVAILVKWSVLRKSVGNERDHWRRLQEF